MAIYPDNVLAVVTTPKGRVYTLYDHSPEWEPEIPLGCQRDEDDIVDELIQLQLAMEKWRFPMPLAGRINMVAETIGATVTYCYPEAPLPPGAIS